MFEPFDSIDDTSKAMMVEASSISAYCNRKRKAAVLLGFNLSM